MKKVDNPVNCKTCGKEIIINATPNSFNKMIEKGVFCSKECRPKRVISDEVRAKMKQGFKNYIDNLTAEQYKEKFSRNKSAIFFQPSKGELLLLTLLQERFPDYNFKSEDMIKHKGKFISIDIFSHEKKIYLEYDGIWHLTDIRGQLKRKQDKEEVLKDYCELNGIRLIRVTDHNYRKEKDLFEEICKVIEDDSIKFIKLYNFERKKFMYETKTK